MPFPVVSRALLTLPLGPLAVHLQVMNEDGQTSTIRDKILTIDVQPGWKRGTRITFEKEGDQVSSEAKNGQVWKGPLEITHPGDPGRVTWSRN